MSEVHSVSLNHGSETSVQRSSPFHGHGWLHGNRTFCYFASSPPGRYATGRQRSYYSIANYKLSDRWRNVQGGRETSIEMSKVRNVQVAIWKSSKTSMNRLHGAERWSLTSELSLSCAQPNLGDYYICQPTRSTIPVILSGSISE